MAGIDAPNYNENARLLSLADSASEGSGRDRRLMRGAPPPQGPCRLLHPWPTIAVSSPACFARQGTCRGGRVHGLQPICRLVPSPTADSNSHISPSSLAAAENVSEEIYGVEHLDVLGSYQQEW